MPQPPSSNPGSADRLPALRPLYATLAMCIVVPLVLMAQSAWTLDRDLWREAEGRIHIELDVLTQHTLRTLQAADLAQDAMRLLTVGMTDAQIRAREPALHAAFHDLADGMPSVQSIWLIGGDGRPMVSSIVSPIPSPFDVTDRDYFKALQAADVGTYIGALRTPKLPGPPFFSVAVRRPAPDGGFNGVISVSLLPTDFENFYSQLDPDQLDVYSMVRTDGAVLARWPGGAKPATFLDPRNSPLMRALARDPAGGEFIARSPRDGTDRINGYRRVPGYPVVLLAGIQTAAIRAQWWAALASHLLLGVPAIAVLVVTLLIAIRRTRLLAAEAERRQAAEAALSRRQRLEAIGQLTGGVAHDFNNLLTIIRGSAERMRRRVGDPRDTRSLDIIERAVQRGAALTRQLLTFASRQALAVEVIDLAPHLERFSEVLRRSLRSDIETEIDLPPNPCVVKVDPGELELALLNISVNARDAMPLGGKLRLLVRHVTLDGGPATDSLSGKFVAVSLSDTGSGIPAQTLARVFEPFFTTKETGKGTGLGLSQVYGFARQSGGTVTIASEPGRGTDVTLYLPLTNETPCLPAGGAAAPTQGRSAGQRILMVEAASDVAEVTRGLLADVGFRVAVARDAEEAMQRLAAEEFDLVIADMIIPGERKGLDLARAARLLHPNVPLVLTSGDSLLADSALREGFAFIQKPYDVDRLREIIEMAMRAEARDPAGAPR